MGLLTSSESDPVLEPSVDMFESVDMLLVMKEGRPDKTDGKVSAVLEGLMSETQQLQLKVRLGS